MVHFKMMMLFNDALINPYLTLSMVIVFVAYFYLNWKSNYWKRRGVNGPKSYPLIGTLWERLFLPLSQLEVKRYQTYGPIYGSMQGWKPTLTIGEPELIKEIRITNFRYFVNHRQLFLADSLIGKILAELKDIEWKRVRNILSPVFSTGKLKAMQPLIDRCIVNALKHIGEIAVNTDEVELKTLTMMYTLDTIAITAFAMETNGYKEKNAAFYRKAKDIITIRIWRLISGLIFPHKMQDFLNISLIDNTLFHYFGDLLKLVLQERKQSKVNRNDFVNLLLHAELSKDENDFLSSDTRKKLTDEEIIAQCCLFFIVGFETTSTLLQYTLYALAMNSKVQQTLFEEIRNYFKEDETIDYESLMNLPYFEAVINESLRMYTPVTMFEHVCSEDYKLGDTGITIEKGTIVNMPYYAMHHDEKLFPHPYEFKPERFLPENGDQIIPYSFLPFGTGPRICIGMRFAILSAKLMIANLVNQFEVIKTENTAPEPEYDDVFFLLSCKPLKVSFKKRE